MTTLWQEQERTEAFKQGHELAALFIRSIMMIQKPPKLINPYKSFTDEWYDFENGYMVGVSENKS